MSPKNGKTGGKTADKTKTPFNSAPAGEGATADPIAAAQAADKEALSNEAASQQASDAAAVTGDNTAAPDAAAGDGEAPAGDADAPAATDVPAPAAPAVQVQTPVVQEKTAQAVAVATKQVVATKPIRNNTTTAPQLRGETPTVKDDSAAQASVASSDFSTLMGNELKKGTANAVALVTFLNDYVATMAPRRPVSDEDVLKYQEQLFSRLKDILERAPVTEFSRLWNIFTAFVKEYKDRAFSPRYSHRGIKEWRRDPQDFQVLSSLLNLVYTAITSEGSTSMLQRVSLESSLKTGLSDDARGRLTLFYRR